MDKSFSLWITAILSPVSPVLKRDWGHGKPLFMRCPKCPHSKKRERKQNTQKPPKMCPKLQGRAASLLTDLLVRNGCWCPRCLPFAGAEVQAGPVAELVAMGEGGLKSLNPFKT